MQLTHTLSPHNSILVFHPSQRLENFNFENAKCKQHRVIAKLSYHSKLLSSSIISFNFNNSVCQRVDLHSYPSFFQSHSKKANFLFCHLRYFSYNNSTSPNFKTYALLNSNINHSTGLNAQFSSENVNSLSIDSSPTSSPSFSSPPPSPNQIDKIKELSIQEYETNDNGKVLLQMNQNLTAVDMEAKQNSNLNENERLSEVSEGSDSEGKMILKNSSIEEVEVEEKEKVAEKLKEESRRKKISMANKGRVPWNKGRSWGEETKAKIRERTAIAMMSPEIRQKLRENARPHTKETKLKIQTKLQELWRSRIKQTAVERAWKNAIASAAKEERMQEMEAFKLERLKIKEEKELKREMMKEVRREEKKVLRRSPRSEEHRKKISEAIKSKWNDPEYRSKVSEGMASMDKTKRGTVKDENERKKRSTKASMAKLIPIIMNENADKEFVAAVMASEKDKLEERRNIDPSLKIKRVKIISRRGSADADVDKKEDAVLEERVEKERQEEKEEEKKERKESYVTMEKGRLNESLVLGGEGEEDLNHEVGGKKKQKEEREEEGKDSETKKEEEEDELIVQKLQVMEEHKNAMEKKKNELMKKAKMLMREAERAASMLEQTFGNDEAVMDALNQTKKFIKETEKSMADTSFSPPSSLPSSSLPSSSPSPSAFSSFSSSSLSSSSSSLAASLSSPSSSSPSSSSFTPSSSSPPTLSSFFSPSQSYSPPMANDDHDKDEEENIQFLTKIKNEKSNDESDLSEKIKIWSQQLNFDSFDLQNPSKTRNVDFDLDFDSKKSTRVNGTSKSDQVKLDLYLKDFRLDEGEKEEEEKEEEEDYKKVDYKNFFKLYAKSMASNLLEFEKKKDGKMVNGMEDDKLYRDDYSNDYNVDYKDDYNEDDDGIGFDDIVDLYEESGDENDKKSKKNGVNMEKKEENVDDEMNSFGKELTRLNSKLNDMIYLNDVNDNNDNNNNSDDDDYDVDVRQSLTANGHENKMMEGKKNQVKEKEEDENNDGDDSDDDIIGKNNNSDHKMNGIKLSNVNDNENLKKNSKSVGHFGNLIKNSSQIRNFENGSNAVKRKKWVKGKLIED